MGFILDSWLIEVIVDVILIIFNRFNNIGKKELIFKAFIYVGVGIYRELGLLGIGAFRKVLTYLIIILTLFRR
jgi:hypothetical protein